MKKMFITAAIILSAIFMWNVGENTARRDLTKLASNEVYSNWFYKEYPIQDSFSISSGRYLGKEIYRIEELPIPYDPEATILYKERYIYPASDY